MPSRLDLTDIHTFKLTEIYHILFEKQSQLNISDEYLLSTVRGTQEDVENRENLIQLLQLTKKARDTLITWYLKQTLVELNVTISLSTAKIKFIEYKLGLCNGLDLHQACSLSLVDFCNILTDMVTKSTTSPRNEKKSTMHVVSKETGLPVWLSHYRNQICHVPSESPCISILVPLVQQSLNYMRDSFWARLLEHEVFDERKFKRLVSHIGRLVHFKGEGRKLALKPSTKLGIERLKSIEASIKKAERACLALRRHMARNPEVTTNLMAEYIVSKKFSDKSRNIPLVLMQITFARCFEKLVFRLLWLTEQNPQDKLVSSWLHRMIILISCPNSQELKEKLNRLGIDQDYLAAHIDISPIKCFRIAYRLMLLPGPEYKRRVLRMRHKLLPILGKERLCLLTKMTRLLGFDEK